MKSRIVRIIAALLLMPPLMVSAQSSWEKSVEAFLADPALSSASVGFSIQEVGKTKADFGYQAQTVLTPASSQKVLTGATALETLGSDHRFSTKLFYRGVIAEGAILNGDLFIVGGGDPSLGSEHLPESGQDLPTRWAQLVKALGIDEIRGKIFYDTGLFDDQTLAPSTAVADAGNYYCGGAHALSWRDNEYTITFQSPDRDGAQARVVNTAPEIPGLELVNEVKASDIQEDRAYVYAIPGVMHQVVRGTIPKGRSEFSIRAANPAPGMLLAHELSIALEASGVDVVAEIMDLSDLKNRKGLEEETTLIASHTSPPLADIVRHMLWTSNNSYADVLLKDIGLAASGDASFTGGSKAIVDHWENRLEHADGMRMKDGSGLSRANSVSAGQLAGVCAMIDGKQREAFRKGLKPLGTSKRVVAKSGTMSGVRSYTGYFTSSDGQNFAFSIIVNHYEGSSTALKKQIIRLMDSLVRS